MRSLTLLRSTLLLFLVTDLLSVGCQSDPSAWYPRCTAGLAAFSEPMIDGLTSCVFTLKVHNTGQSRVAKSTISVKVATERRVYYATVVSDIAILPGGTVYVTGSVAYVESTEATSAERITVVDQFYE